MKTSWVRLILATLPFVLMAACSTQSVSNADYVLREMAIDGPSILATPYGASIHATNTGEYPHTLVVTDDRGQVIGATGLVEPGGQTSLEVDLEPGTYVFSCRIVAQDGEGNLNDHYEQGMHRTVAVSNG